MGYKQREHCASNRHDLRKDHYDYLPLLLPGSVHLNHRRKSRVVPIGDVPLGEDYPIRIQSMTISDTMDTAATVAETIQLVEAGCEIVRITAPSLNEAENLRHIKAELRRRGVQVPLP